MAAVEEPRTEVRAQARYVRTAPRKAQLVVEQIRGQSVLEARATLAFITRDAARDVEKVLESAVANALQGHNLDPEDLYVSAAYVGAGPTIKRWRARARGRVARIRKRTCHITVRLSQADGAELPGPARVEAPPVEEEKPKRTPRKKAEPAEAAEDKRAPSKKAEAAEEKPKSGRAAKSKGAAEEKDVGAEHARPAKRAKKKEGDQP
jgi:large subunit ribosomal protein L22